MASSVDRNHMFSKRILSPLAMFKETFKLFAHKAALMTKTELIFPAFFLTFADLAVQFCFCCKFAFHEKLEAIASCATFLFLLHFDVICDLLLNRCRQHGIYFLSRNIELKQAVDAMMGQAKRICILIIKVNKFFFFFLLWHFLKQIENMFSVLLSSYRNTCESLWELEKAVETVVCRLVQNFLFSQTSIRVSLT